MQRKPRLRRRGNIIVLSSALLICLMALVALAVDVGYIAHAHTELQRTADAVSLAAAARLPDQGAALDAGMETADNNATSIGTSLLESDFVFGWWNRNNSTFTSPAPSNRPTNAVKVTVVRTAARGNPLNLFLGPIVGKDSADITVTSTAYMDRSLCGAFVGIEWLDVHGNPGTDSFDSIDSPYNSENARHRGSVCSDGDITISGDSYLKGDARAGVGGDVIITGDITITGNIGNRVKPLNMPPVDTTIVSTSNDNGELPLLPRGNHLVSPMDKQGDFVLNSGDIYTLPPGDYFFRNVTINGGATLNITGETNVYITGNLTRNGGTWVNNNTQKAENLKFLMTGGTANFTSDNGFYGVLYAPNTDVSVSGTADFFGAAVGKTLKVTGGGRAHYDESLELEQIDPPTRTTIVD